MIKNFRLMRRQTFLILGYRKKFILHPRDSDQRYQSLIGESLMRGDQNPKEEAVPSLISHESLARSSLNLIMIESIRVRLEHDRKE